MSTRPPPTWLITGTSSGLGLSLSKLILQKGHNLVSISRHPEPDRSLIDLAKSYTPPDTTGSSSTITPTTPSPTPSAHLAHIPLDLSTPTPTQLTQPLTTFLTNNPSLRPTILINNAAITSFSALETTSPTQLQKIMTTNFFSPLYLIQAVLPFMRRNFDSPPSSSTEEKENEPTKVIVNISSTQGLCTDPSETAYDASKHALEAMSGVLAGEVATFGIRVMVVNLGSLRTGFARGGERGGLSEPQQQKEQEKKPSEPDPESNPNPYADPTHPVARRIAGVKKLVDVPGLARGDPDKTAAILFDAVMRTKGTVVDDVLEVQRQRTVREAGESGIGRVERLVLGSDAQPKIERGLERLRADVEGCRGVSGLVEADG